MFKIQKTETQPRKASPIKIAPPQKNRTKKRLTAAGWERLKKAKLLAQ